jgi:hypothetical protein
MQEGYVYLIEREDGCVKIGVSVNPKKRIQALSLQGGFVPKNTNIYGPMPNYQEIEAELHNEFKDYHYIGEWFQVSISQPRAMLEDTRWMDSVAAAKKSTEKSISGENYRLYQHRGYYYVYTKGNRFSLKTKDREVALDKLAGFLNHPSHSKNREARKRNWISFDEPETPNRKPGAWPPTKEDYMEMEDILLRHDRDVLLGITKA